jgi:murein DD-endopeptidase MepM/ murein hydrolase activator NlpD
METENNKKRTEPSENSSTIDFKKEKFEPVVIFNSDPIVIDLSEPGSESQFEKFPYTIGRYNEKRGIYNTSLFTSETSSSARNIHLGIDIGCPIGTSVYAPAAGKVFKVGYNPAAGDYGYCLITEHFIQGRRIFFLFGHLNQSVLDISPEETLFKAGDLLGYVGSKSENGGWPPHLHFQLSYRVPTTHDLPGVCSEEDRLQCLHDFPDPRLVLGMLYDDDAEPSKKRKLDSN